MRKKLKGVLTIEAAMILPIFVIIILSIVINIRLVVLRGVVHTAVVSSMESVTRASQIINILDCVDDVSGGVPTDSQALEFSGYMCAACGMDEYSDEARNLYDEIGLISSEGYEKLLKQVLEEELQNNLREYIMDSFTTRMITYTDIKVTEVEVTDCDEYKLFKCIVEYPFHFPIDIIENQDRVGKQEMIAYIE